jgi:hypothetical protein
LGPGLGERERERAEPGPDLHHPVAGSDLGQRGDPARQGRLDQEMLSQGLPWTDTVPGGESPERARRQTAGKRPLVTT